MSDIASIFLLLAVVFGCGYWVVRAVFLGRDWGPAWAACFPAGLSLLVIIGLSGYRLGFAVSRLSPVVPLILILASAMMAWLHMRASKEAAVLVAANPIKPAKASKVRKPVESRKPPGNHEAKWGILALGMGCVLLAGWPGLWTGFDRYMAYANPDANNYQFIADRLLRFSHTDPLVVDGHHPGNFRVSAAVGSRERKGADTFLA